ncbi:MAG: DUF4091 domain-containing protein [Clostridia bacterium]|nr:DUF4091 domain-containing protein [Clostridia bacterium]
MKRALLVTTMVVLLMSLCAGVFSNAAETSNDPADIYVPQTAAYEDPTLDLWFEHSFKKVMTSDTTHSGMDTYSVYMAKNEIENAQFVLYSDETKEKMRASVTDFMDEFGNVVDAELYYQMYVTLENIGVTDYIGATAENTFLRNGEQPDPIVPTSKIGRFQLNGGKSQAFYIRLKTTEDTPSGWYSAQLNVYNSASQVVKTATVYAYVWDFTIEEETALKTSFYMNNKPDNYGSYKEYYDYMLENRLLLMDVPGELNSSNPYLTNERVNAVRVTFSNGGNTNTYMESYPGTYYQYADIYTDLSSMKEWEQIKDKFYFYTVDEPMSKEHQDRMAAGANSGHTIDDVKATSEALEKYWPNAATVVPYHENHPYPYYTYETPIASMDLSLVRDATQEMIDTASCTIWCPKTHGLTPNYELKAHNYDGGNPYGTLRSLSATISGTILAGERFFNWADVYGDFSDRVLSNNIVRNKNGNNDELWAYTAGQGGSYVYAHHLIENTGLQTKMLFWQMYQEDVTGYLYYDVTKWEGAVDNTVTGNRTGAWQYNLGKTGGGGNSYGGGVLFYSATQGGFANVDYIGSVRIEILRDGVEDYQMFTMLEELKGNAAADKIVDSVSKNVANYISIPHFDRSALDPTLDDYDVMAMTRVNLGNQVEAASKDVCQHNYDEGVVTKEATCLVMGERTHTCTLCGAVNVEHIPTLHADGEHWEKTVVTPTGCETNGKTKYVCTVCSYTTYKEEVAYHNNDDLLEYVVNEKMPNVHDIYCPCCEQKLDNKVHTYMTEYTNTCVDAGEQNDVCIYCGYTVKVADVEAHGHNMKETTVAPTCTEEGYTGGKCYTCGHEEGETLAALGHSYVDGVCANCGEADPDAVTVEKGDIDGNGSINSVDLFKMNLFVKQITTPTDEEYAAADIDGSGKVNSVDMFYLKFRILKGEWGI